MGVFGRGNKANQSDKSMDDAVPFLTKADADHVRTLVANEFRHRGLDVTVHADHFEAADGGVFGLWNVAATCHDAADARADWPEIVKHHVNGLLAPTPDVDGLSDSELLAAVYARVYGIGTLPSELLDNFGYGNRLADGLIEILVLDTPESVITLGAAEVAKRDASALWATGRARTRSVEIEQVEWIEIKGHGKFAVVLGESVYTASRILDIPSLLARIYGERDYPHGAVVAVPHRHQIVALAIDDLGAIPAIGHLATFAMLGFQEGIGGISPDAYWWDGTGLTRISQIGEDRRVQILAGPEFTEVLNSLKAH